MKLKRVKIGLNEEEYHFFKSRKEDKIRLNEEERQDLKSKHLIGRVEFSHVIRSIENLPKGSFKVPDIVCFGSGLGICWLFLKNSSKVRLPRYVQSLELKFGDIKHEYDSDKKELSVKSQVYFKYLDEEYVIANEIYLEGELKNLEGVCGENEK